MNRRSFALEIFVISLAAIVFEIAHTRIFSYKIYYYFTYLIIGLGLLGLGSGGILVAVSKRLRESDLEKRVGAACVAAGLSILVGYFVVALLPLHVSQLTMRPGEIPKLVVAALVLIVPFLSVGIAIASILGANPARAGRLYGFDLLGAGLGCAASIPLLSLLDPPRSVMLSGLLMTLAGLHRASPRSITFVAGVPSALALLLLTGVPGWLPEPVADESKHAGKPEMAGRVEFSQWHPVFRVDAARHPDQPGLVLLLHDGTLGSAIHEFAGELSDHVEFETNSRSLPFSVLGRDPEVLIIGAAGGHEVLASLYMRAGRVVGVELNPVTHGLLTERYAEFAGNLNDDPRVDIIRAEGRSFLGRTDDRFDLVWLVAPDSYAAMNASSAGAFVLSESYLYTVEMVDEILDHLQPGGVLSAQFGELDYDRKPNRSVRYLSTVRAALQQRGVTDFSRHVLVSSAPGIFEPQTETTVLVSATPFTAEQIAGFGQRLTRIRGVPRHVPGQVTADGPVNQVIGMPWESLDAWYAEQVYSLDAVYDDSPFFWRFARFRDAIRSPFEVGGYIVDFEDLIGEQVTLILLCLSAVFGGFFLLLPLFWIRQATHAMPGKLNSFVYFASLGLGFMFIEVSMIQRLTLFLGYPTHSLTVTLFALLMSSGVGSLLSERYVDRRNPALLFLLAGLFVVVLACQFGLPWLIDIAAGTSLAVRIVLTVLVLTPMGLCMGAFLPLGLASIASISDYEREYVAWAWAINGFFSVIASILATLLAMTIGFQAVLWTAMAIYAVGVGAMLRLPAASSPAA